MKVLIIKRKLVIAFGIFRVISIFLKKKMNKPNISKYIATELYMIDARNSLLVVDIINKRSNSRLITIILIPVYVHNVNLL